MNLLDAHLLVFIDSYFRIFFCYGPVLLSILYLFFISELSHSLPPEGPVLSSSYVVLPFLYRRHFYKFFFKLIFIGVELIYSVVLVFVV